MATDKGKARIVIRSASICCDPALPANARCRVRNKRGKEHLMLDFVMLALGLGFFALSIGYAYACERL
jgi:hypothetical protein